MRFDSKKKRRRGESVQQNIEQLAKFVNPQVFQGVSIKGPSSSGLQPLQRVSRSEDSSHNMPNLDKDSFTEREWKNLYKLSENTFVEETESLKKSAAGAGLTDND